MCGCSLFNIAIKSLLYIMTIINQMEIIKMMLNKVSEWRVRVLEKAKEDNQDVCFKLTALWSSEDNGFVLNASVDGKGELFVSSQRQDRRVFKTLDAVRKATMSCGIPWFEVIG